jgi:hypothetical protein
MVKAPEEWIMGCMAVVDEPIPGPKMELLTPVVVGQ